MTINNYHKIFIIILLNCTLLMGQQERAQVSKLKVTTLSTMLVNGKGVGEWGYSALIEVDGKKILIGTQNPEDAQQTLKTYEAKCTTHEN